MKLYCGKFKKKTEWEDDCIVRNGILVEVYHCKCSNRECFADKKITDLDPDAREAGIKFGCLWAGLVKRMLSRGEKYG